MVKVCTASAVKAGFISDTAATALANSLNNKQFEIQINSTTGANVQLLRCKANNTASASRSVLSSSSA